MNSYKGFFRKHIYTICYHLILFRKRVNHRRLIYRLWITSNIPIILSKIFGSNVRYLNTNEIYSSSEQDYYCVDMITGYQYLSLNILSDDINTNYHDELTNPDEVCIQRSRFGNILLLKTGDDSYNYHVSIDNLGFLSTVPIKLVATPLVEDITTVYHRTIMMKSSYK